MEAAVPATPAPAMEGSAPAAEAQTGSTPPVENPTDTNTPDTGGSSLESTETTETSTPDPVDGSTEDKATDPFTEFAKDKKANPVPEAKPSEVPVEAPPGEPGDWKDVLPKQFQNNPYLNRFGSMEEFLKGVQNLQGLASKKGLVRPDADAPPEHWNDYWDTIGRPTSPDDYDIQDIRNSAEEVVFEFDKEQLPELRREFHKQGLTNDQAQFMMDKYAKLQMSMTEDKSAQQEQAKLQTLTNLQKDYKETTDQVIRQSLDALEGLGIYDALVDHGAEIDERVIRAGIKLSSEFSEAVLGPRGSTKSSQDRLNEIENSNAFRNRSDPNHKKVVAEREQLLKELY